MINDPYGSSHLLVNGRSRTTARPALPWQVTEDISALFISPQKAWSVAKTLVLNPEQEVVDEGGVAFGNLRTVSPTRTYQVSVAYQAVGPLEALLSVSRWGK